MGETRDVFKKIRDTKGTFHAKMGSIKDRNGIDLREAEDIKKRWQEYTEELYKKILMTQITWWFYHSPRARHPGMWSQVGFRKHHYGSSTGGLHAAAGAATMSLVIPEKFQHILRVLNTNIDGRQKIAFAITAIKGVGRRYAHVVLRKADIDLTKRAGELTEDEVERVITIMQDPHQYKIPDSFLNRQKDVKDGKYSQVLANGLDNKLREDLERLKKIRAHRGLRHFWGLRVRGQHTKTTGRRGRTVGVSKKK